MVEFIKFSIPILRIQSKSNRFHLLFSTWFLLVKRIILFEEEIKTKKKINCQTFYSGWILKFRIIHQELRRRRQFSFLFASIVVENVRVQGANNLFFWGRNLIYFYYLFFHFVGFCRREFQYFFYNFFYTIFFLIVPFMSTANVKLDSILTSSFVFMVILINKVVRCCSFCYFVYYNTARPYRHHSRKIELEFLMACKKI